MSSEENKLNVNQQLRSAASGELQLSTLCKGKHIQ